MKNTQIPFMTKVPYYGKIGSRENIFIFRACLENLEKLKYLSRNGKAISGEGDNNNISSSVRIRIDVEKSKIKDWLRKYDDGSPDRIIMQHREDELRLMLVKRFIYEQSC